MSAPVGFLAMRADLVSRGLLDEGHRLTPDGHVYVDQLLDCLVEAEAPCDPSRPRVRWNTRRDRRRARA